MKYVVGYIEDSGVLEAIVFPKHIFHRSAAAHKKMRVVSAGFFMEDCIAYGRSESLGVDSNPAVDTPLIKVAYEQYKQNMSSNGWRPDK